MLLQIVTMGVIFYVVFINIPFSGNKAKYNTIFCNDQYGKVGASKCNYVHESPYTWVFYILYTIYFILCAIQIRYGENFMKLQKECKWSLIEKLELTMFKMTPFVFPIKTALDWSSTKTSLKLFDWFKFLDIKYLLQMAKFSDESRKKQKFGEPQSMKEKIIMGWVLVIGLLTLLFLPLLFFSTFSPFALQNSVNEGSMKLS